MSLPLSDSQIDICFLFQCFHCYQGPPVIRPFHLCLPKVALFGFSDVLPSVCDMFPNLLHPFQPFSSAFFIHFHAQNLHWDSTSFHPLAIFFCYLWIHLPRYCHLSVTSHRVRTDNWIYSTPVTRNYNSLVNLYTLLITKTTVHLKFSVCSPAAAR